MSHLQAKNINVYYWKKYCSVTVLAFDITVFLKKRKVPKKKKKKRKVPKEKIFM